MGPFLQTVIGAIVWALANLVYLDLRRRGVRGFGRFAAFWVGTPTTWLSFLLVPEGVVPQIEPPQDDEERLLREIRVDRELRGRPSPPRATHPGSPRATPPGESGPREALPG